ncbi:MAG: protein-L-isoaspartate(D-aspartate) O-methyltransferase [bacterium]
MVQYTNPEIARKRLADVILPKSGISDLKVLGAFRKIPRHLFVEEALQLRAYEDKALPIGHGQTISQPSTIGMILQTLDLTGKERVLEIGSGSGYQSALLACLAENVFTIERIPALAKQAWNRLSSLGISNVAIRTGDGTYGWPDQSPYDAILVSAGSPGIPDHLIQQLRVGGRMMIPVGGAKTQRLIKIVKRPSGIERSELDLCQFVKLIGKFGWEKKQTNVQKETHELD